jgi:hypothetical protein
MSTAFATLQAALLAALTAAPALAGGRISANRLRPIPTGQSTAIVLRLDQAEAQEQVLGALDWQTAFVVECYARAAAGVDPQPAVDSLLNDVWQRLAAREAASLGASITISPKVDWQYDDADTPVVCAVIHLVAQHRTALTTLQPWN